ncbi:MAG: hypothetical protein M1814_003997 [Vezdaea aestivalis]|nr:MAG: hypothetical protein M1814_003997 [Vezdaea aestivalis]
MKRRAEDTLEKPEGSVKKAALGAAPEDLNSHFDPSLFSESILSAHRSAYNASNPYPHGILPAVFNDAFLRLVVRDSILLTMAIKTTDIYQFMQSQDLVSLESLRKPPTHLLALRNALYSPRFLSYLSTITSCGPLSPSKRDMSVTNYTTGCHLLCHDDMIGTRRLSYILYLTDPDQPWQAEWGGALRLFGSEVRTAKDGRKVRVALPEVEKIIPPSFGQLVVFEVRPGESFHDVQEVVDRVPRQPMRRAISGWFHAPQVGEEGYDEEAEEQREKEMSSLAALSAGADEFDLPAEDVRLYEQEGGEEEGGEEEGGEEEGEEDEAAPLSAADLDFLLRFLAPSYLTPDSVEELAGIFESESVLSLSRVLAPKFAQELFESLSAAELSAASSEHGWQLAAPPHKHRYHYQSLPPADSSSPETPLSRLLGSLLPSTPFRKWLGLVTGLTPTTFDLLARRFRRGADYALATASTAEAQLEVRFGVSPSFRPDKIKKADNDENAIPARKKPTGSAIKETPTKPYKNPKPTANGSASDSEEASTDIETPTSAHAAPSHEVEDKENGNPSDWSEEEDEAAEELALARGGFESYMAPSSGEEDAAVYKVDDDDEDGDGAVLFQTPAAWDRLTIVLRDGGVLRFVKYLEDGARGDRWDVGGVYGVDVGGEAE